MVFNKLIPLLMLGAVAVISGCKTTASTGSVNSYAARNVRLDVCSGYGCIYKNQFTISRSQTNSIRRIMNSGKRSAQSERRAIGRAVARMEQYARARLLYGKDVGKAFQRHSGLRGQMDCVDESLNTTEYLSFFEGQGMLRHHTTRKRYAERGLIFDGAYPHKTAVIRQKNGVEWAIDSWPANHGKRPQIMKLSVWYKKKNTDS